MRLKGRIYEIQSHFQRKETWEKGQGQMKFCRLGQVGQLSTNLKIHKTAYSK